MLHWKKETKKNKIKIKKTIKCVHLQKLVNPSMLNGGKKMLAALSMKSGNSWLLNKKRNILIKKKEQRGVKNYIV